MKLLGVITARGGSKGIPRKNIKELGGKPLIAWTIEAAEASGIFDRLILSTDDPEIAAVGKRCGAEVPFMRPAELAQDNTPALPVIQHAVKWLKDNEGYWPEAVMLLQPTAPFRQPQHIKEALDLFNESDADSVVSVTEIPGHYSPYWATTENETGWGVLLSGEPIRNRIPRRQEFPKKTYVHNSAVYLFRPELLFDPSRPSIYGEKVKLYVMDSRYSVNLDQAEDWEEAERAIKNLKS